MIDILIQVLLYISAAFMVLGAIGMLRFPDLYTRIHAATMITVGGVCFSLLILAVTTFWNVYTVRIIIITIFTLITSPTISHALANSAYKIDIKPKRIVKNEMSQRVLRAMQEEEEEL